jgi:hypothetical protein
MGEPVRERAVVREQECARRVGVEPADGNHPRGMLDQVDDSRAALRIARRRDDAGRLVEKHVGKRLWRDRPPVQFDRVALADESAEIAELAVHAHAAGADEFVRLAARRHACAREVCIEAHADDFSRSAGTRKRRSLTSRTMRSIFRG